MPKITIVFEDLTESQVQSLQNALGFASWQFKEGDLEEAVKIVDELHDKVEKQTGLKSEF